MLRVNSFCGCVKLESFATFFAKFAIVCNSIIAVIYAITVVLLLIRGIFQFIFVPVLLFSLCALTIYACKKLIDGVKTRDPKKIQWFRVLCFIGVILALLEVIVFIWRIFVVLSNDENVETKKKAGIVLLLLFLGFGWQTYVFICIDSLYRKIEDEKFPGTVTQSIETTIAYPNAASSEHLPQSVQVQIYPELKEKI